MNRIYQNRVTKVETPGGKTVGLQPHWEQLKVDELSPVQRHELRSANDTLLHPVP